MSKQQYRIREKATGNEITCDWQNAFELVNHGFWEWANGNGRKEFKKAQADARRTNSDPSGFRDPIEDEENEDDEEEYVAPTPAPAKPAVKIEDVAATIVTPEGDELDDMTKEELVEYAKKIGVTLDKRHGQKTMVSALRAAQEREA